MSSTQSQTHGFIFENSIRERIFDLLKEKNNTDKHDIPKYKNKYNNNDVNLKEDKIKSNL
jgi:hypothetical protein